MTALNVDVWHGCWYTAGTTVTVCPPPVGRLDTEGEGTVWVMTEYGDLINVYPHELTA